MIRRLAAGLIVVGLAVGIWALWPRDGSDPTSTTVPLAVETTTTLDPTTTVAESSTTTAGTHVVTNAEEAEEILRALWFGWFEGIYNQDENRIREVVGTQTMLDAARNAFDSIEFVEPPTSGAINFLELEILRSDADCLAAWVSGNAPFLDAPTISTASVEVMRWTGTTWVLVSTWQFRDDLWEADCESDLEPLQ